MALERSQLRTLSPPNATQMKMADINPEALAGFFVKNIFKPALGLPAAWVCVHDGVQGAGSMSLYNIYTRLLTKIVDQDVFKNIVEKQAGSSTFVDHHGRTFLIGVGLDLEVDEFAVRLVLAALQRVHHDQPIFTELDVDWEDVEKGTAALLDLLKILREKSFNSPSALPEPSAPPEPSTPPAAQPSVLPGLTTQYYSQPGPLSVRSAAGTERRQPPRDDDTESEEEVEVDWAAHVQAMNVM